METPLSDYLAHIDRVPGWLVPFSARFIASIAEIQTKASQSGSLGEVGVHMGRLFLVLKLSARPDEPLFAVDVFEDQHLNVDRSGAGVRAAFLANLERWSGAIANVHVIARSSLTVTPDEILGVCGPVRLFSVDGGHTAECTKNDLALAESVLQPFGVVVLDDLFNPYWPDIMTGLAAYLERGQLRPFAITPNKVYFCTIDFADSYRRELRARYNADYDKSAAMFGAAVDVYGERYHLNHDIRRKLARSRLGRYALRLPTVGTRLPD